MPGTRDLLLLCVLALGSGNGHLLVNWAHDRVSATVASLILLIVPLLASLWAHLVHDEPFGLRHVLGIVLVMAAIEGGRRAQQRALRRAAAAATS
jgi:drug/metabolite transporter (DMT)-like permease